MAREFLDKGFGVTVSSAQVDIELRAYRSFDNLPQRSRAIRRLPNRRCHWIQREQGRIADGHDNHLVGKEPGRNFTTARDVTDGHSIVSQTSGSGLNTNRLTGTRRTKSHAD